MPRQIITRFAPSPTGYLHIGGARTALFNWLYARGALGADQGAGKGKFLLRIEDTDRSRHNEAAVQAIFEGMRWLGMDWDGEPISQFSRTERHAEVANLLLEKGLAYRCWLAGDTLQQAKDDAKSIGKHFESPYRNSATPGQDSPFAIRFKAPRDGETVIQDRVQGTVTFPASALDDMVLLRSDGSPTYMLAVVVDDHDMDISHIIRGDDHLVNAARQQQVYEALGWQIPEFAHLPLIHGQDGAKLSKRHGALGVEAYRDLGYMAEGLRNYLLRLGWSHGDEEIIPQSKALAWFDINNVRKGAARLDLDKLAFVNHHYLKETDAVSLIQLATPFIEASHGPLTSAEHDRLIRGASFLKERAKTLIELAEQAEFLLLKRPLEITGKAAKPLKKEGARERITPILHLLEKVLPENWQIATLEKILQDYAAEHEIGFGQIGQPVRAALTAGRPSPSLGEVLYTLGQPETLARLSDQQTNISP